MLNSLFSDHDLAKLTADQREFLAQRIDHALDTDPRIREIISAKLKGIVSLAHSDVAVLK